MTSKRACALLALLAMTPSGERARVWLQSMLWGSRGIEQAQASLRRELSSLVQTLDASGAPALITRNASHVVLDLDRIDVDALAITPRLDRDVTLFPVFLEGFDLPGCDEFEDWLRTQRRRIEEVCLTVIEPPLAGSVTPQALLGGPLPPRSDLVVARPPPLVPKPSIAVLPFSAGDTSNRDAVERGLMLAEAISMSLASYPHIFVVSTSSAAMLLERGQLPGEIAVTLGVQYLLEGTLAEGEDAMRVSVRIVDGANGIQRWASSFRHPHGDALALHDEIAQAITPQIWTRIDQAERHRGLSRPARMDNSYHLYWRANALLHQWTSASIREALVLTEDLVAHESESGWAASLCAFCNAAAFSTGWTANPEAARRTAMLQYQNALRLEPDNVEVMGYCAGTLALTGGDLRIADHLVDRALSLFPAYQPSLFWGGWVDLASDRPARASERFELSLRINPVSGVRAHAITGIGLARLMMGEIDEAYALLFEAHIHIPQYALTMAGLYMAARLKGETSVAATIATRLRRSGDLDRVFALFPSPMHRAMLEASLSQG
ncbi:hypothetical protein [Sphingomonas sp.]|uniref:tetratricopeptide repeat protein n=1 Tax=Sphingomonas sp. TaxID=28214 RepID=UPI001B1E3C81|nr:hypothetical protein [Sphingomonas sp.]MBO9712731.1 hypothetical protein [Sphingomonas sp.]